jgi:hypothetical protein
MKRLAIGISILCGLLFLTACGGSAVDRPLDVNYKSGTDGITLEVIDNHPPKTLLENNRFSIAVQVSNKGAYDMGDGEIFVIGLNDALNILDIDEAELPPLDGRSAARPQGGFYVQEFTGQNVAMPHGATQYNTRFFAQAEYEYKTTLNQDVCVSSSLLRIEKQQDVCTVEDEIRLRSQGAPVAFTKMEEVVSPVQEGVFVQVTFTIENRGDGKVISPIEIDDVLLGTRRLKCNKREITEYGVENGFNTVTCSGLMPEQGAYTTTVSASLFYRYRQTEEGAFTVQKVR